jgi:hypothetical protein
MIEKASRIRVISGEGEKGTSEIYKGKRTAQAVKTYLTKERVSGARWAILEVDGEKI